MLINRFLFVVAILWGTSISASENLSKAIKDIDANVIFMRHALAPGFGDPENFNINDCSTQRNLSSVGIYQSKVIGQAILSEGIKFDEILSSQWCRCKDTAINLELGNWTEFRGLNSFFEGHANRIETLKLLNEKLDSIKDKKLVLMITHQVVISSVTGKFVDSGGIILYNSRTGKSKHYLIKSL